jgi:hypothetical protein
MNEQKEPSTMISLRVPVSLRKWLKSLPHGGQTYALVEGLKWFKDNQPNTDSSQPGA